MGGWVGGWLENEFLKKTPSPKFSLESQLGTSDFGVCQYYGPSERLIICFGQQSQSYPKFLIMYNKTNRKVFLMNEQVSDLIQIND